MRIENNELLSTKHMNDIQLVEGSENIVGSEHRQILIQILDHYTKYHQLQNDQVLSHTACKLSFLRPIKQ